MERSDSVVQSTYSVYAYVSLRALSMYRHEESKHASEDKHLTRTKELAGLLVTDFRHEFIWKQKRMPCQHGVFMQVCMYIQNTILVPTVSLSPSYSFPFIIILKLTSSLTNAIGIGKTFSNLGNLLVRMITLFARRISAKHFLRCKSQSRLCDFRCLSTTDNANAKYMDVLIVGGGAVGCALAHALNRFLPNLKVGLLEARDAPKMAPNSEIPHPRSYALSPASLQLLGDTITSQLQMGYYDSMQVWQANSPASLTFTTRDLDADPLKAPYLGACVEDGPLVASLWKEIENSTCCWTNTTLESIITAGDSHTLATVTTNQGETIQAGLLVGADGGNSWVRRTLGISRSGTEYDQHALTFTVKLNAEMNMRAFQRFLSDGGPMALLPTHSPKHGVVVWSTSPETVRKWKVASEEDFVQHLNDCMLEGPQRIPPLLEHDQSSPADIVSNLLYGAERVLDTLHYGLAMASHYPMPKYTAPPQISEIVSPKFSFPLSCFQAKTYVKDRVALLGDAAHTVHPMAGQGLNLGLADVQVLLKTIEKASKAGMDVSSFLQEYHTNRQRNVSISLGGIHALQRTFGNQDVALLHAKTLGMNVIQNLGPLRRQIALAAAHGISI